ncbi:ras-related protein Rab-10-like isoform X2 [Stegodyphus dumicola]|uniref:ras-related protein Rab-10-like isoform X2 n=1 Tax=Stegodyphus dumicola TaxID=202533 RepID=UPI0015A95F63|nr:ras-related protein Rab-10-like isoform X2 [Stegodyphus dumicola]
MPYEAIYSRKIFCLYRNTDGIILVCDLTNAKSFLGLDSWLADVKNYCDDDVPVIIAGNKMDEANKRAVTQKMIRDFANEEKYQFLETSAKDNINVELVFFSLLKEVLQKKNLIPPGPVAEMRVVPKKAIQNSESRLPEKLPAEKVDIISLKLHNFKESTRTEVKSSAAQTGEERRPCSC